MLYNDQLYTWILNLKYNLKENKFNQVIMFLIDLISVFQDMKGLK